MLRAGTLTLNDIVFRQGDVKWLRISEFTDLDFTKEIPSQNLSAFVDLPEKEVAAKSEKKEGKNVQVQEWILLVKIRNQGETKFVQQGPFSIEEIKNKIQAGQTRYNDYIWKKGFEKWERIGDLDDFSFRGETQIFTQATSATSSQRFPEAPKNISTVKILNRKNINKGLDEFTKTEVKISERTVVDENKSDPTIVYDESQSRKKSDTIGFDTGKTLAVIERSSRKRQRKNNKSIQTALMAVIIIGLVIIVRGVIKDSKLNSSSEKTRDLSSKVSAKKRPDIKKEIQKERPVEKIIEKVAEKTKEAKPETAKSEVSPEIPAEPPREVPRVAEPPPLVVNRKGKAFVKVRIKDISGRNPKVAVSSNAVDGEKIKVKIKGVTGELLVLPSFSWENNVVKKRGVDPEVSLPSLGVSSGYYFISAELADATFETGKIFIGNKKEFASKISEHRKRISFRQQQEKKQLFKLMNELTLKADMLFVRYKETSSPSEFSQFLSGWRNQVQRITTDDFKSFGQRTKNNYAFPEMWESVKDLKEKLLDEGRKLEASFDSSRKTAADVSTSVVNEIQKLIQRISELSGWKSKKP